MSDRLFTTAEARDLLAREAGRIGHNLVDALDLPRRPGHADEYVVIGRGRTEARAEYATWIGVIDDDPDPETPHPNPNVILVHGHYGIATLREAVADAEARR